MFAIRKSTKDDLARIMEIFAYARQFMAEHGNPNQWGPNNWPPQEVIEKDIEAGKSYVCVTDDDDSHILGTFFYDCGKDVEPDYLHIEDGEWENGATYGVVHRIANSGEMKGVGSFCINWAYDQCGRIRMDTHDDNYVMQNLLTKLGFVRTGIIYVAHDNTPRVAFEKK